MIKHPISSDYLKAIGDVTVSFALLELSTKHIIDSVLFNNQRYTDIITSETSFRSIRAHASNLFLEKFGVSKKYKELIALMKKADSIEKRRNEIIHSYWGAGDRNTITRIKTTAKLGKGLINTFEIISLNDLENFATEIKTVCDEFEKFRFDFFLKNQIQ